MLERKFINTKELALVLGTTENAVWSMKARGFIPERLILKIGRSVRYDYNEIIQWLNELKTVEYQSQQGENNHEK